MSNAISKPSGPVGQVPEAGKVNVPKVPWNPFLAVGFVVIVYFVSQLIAGFLVSIYALSTNLPRSQVIDWLNNSVGAQFAYILIAEALVVAAVYWFLRFYKQVFAIIGLKRPRWRDPAYGLLALPVYVVWYLIILVIVEHLVPSLNVNQQQQLGFNHVVGAGPLLLAFISLVILPPLGEEILVRGFLYSSLKKAVPPFGAVIITSAIFASAHLSEGGAAGPLYIAALDTFVLSLVLIYLREATGSLWPSITLHAIKNAIAFTALFAFHLR